jgi:hypothetical protein
MLKIVLAGSSGPGDAAIFDALTASNHEVAQCHDPAHGSTCAVVAGAACPMDGDVDVAVVPLVAAGAAPAQADGVGCAVRASIPVVVVGHGAPGPFQAVAAATANQPGDVVTACERAASGVTDMHSAVAAQALGERIDSLGLPAESAARLSASVRRTPTGLRLEFTHDGLLSPGVAERVGLQVLAALRQSDERARGISLAIV